MSLWDVDKAGQNRLTPTPNTKDFVPIDMRMAHGTTGFTLVDEATGEVSKLVIKDGKLTVFREDGSGLVTRIGVRDSDGKGVTEVAKPSEVL